MSVNNVTVNGDASFNSHVFINDLSVNNVTVTGDASFNSHVFINDLTVNNLDLLKLVSVAKDMSGNGGNYSGRYFCVGDLLIQFSDFSDIFPTPLVEGDHQLYFPTPYDSNPYTVILTPTKPASSDNFFVTLKSFTKDEFTYHTGQSGSGTNNPGNTGFFSIGPKPSTWPPV